MLGISFVVGNPVALAVFLIAVILYAAYFKSGWDDAKWRKEHPFRPDSSPQGDPGPGDPGCGHGCN